jgi:hypothetical protein
MAEEFEDPRKAELRVRATDAVDAAGYSVDRDRSVIDYPQAVGLKGGIRGDVVATGAQGVRTVYFVRVDGNRPLPQWLANHVKASFALQHVEIYVVAEDIGDQLRVTCQAAGAGLLKLRSDNTFDKELDYTVIDDSADRRRLQKRVKDARTRLDAKLRLNQARLEEMFKESSAVTATLTAKRRDVYLTELEDAMGAWRTWAQDLSERLDLLAAAEDADALSAVEKAIVDGPPGLGTE